MTELELVREALLGKGFKKSQVESAVVNGLLDLMTGADSTFTDTAKALRDLETLNYKKRELIQEIHMAQAIVSELEQKRNDIVERINAIADAHYRSTTEYINSFLNALENCETSEAKDTLRIAQMFVNTVQVDTKYDNTAFIIGLSAILSNGKIAPIEELRKINKQIPQITVSPSSVYPGYSVRENGQIKQPL